MASGFQSARPVRWERFVARRRRVQGLPVGHLLQWLRRSHVDASFERSFVDAVGPDAPDDGVPHLKHRGRSGVDEPMNAAQRNGSGGASSSETDRTIADIVSFVAPGPRERPLVAPPVGLLGRARSVAATRPPALLSPSQSGGLKGSGFRAWARIGRLRDTDERQRRPNPIDGRVP